VRTSTAFESSLQTSGAQVAIIAAGTMNRVGGPAEMRAADLLDLHP